MNHTSRMLKLPLNHPRRNLPVAISRKRGESNFVAVFADAYIRSISSHGVGGREFALSGFGVADFVWLAWTPLDGNSEGSALSLKRFKADRLNYRLTAFEMKLTDWRKGLAQAYRYSYFADLSVVVLPPDTARLAIAELALFRQLRVGLWSFDKKRAKIRKLFTPSESKPRNLQVKEKALELLGHFLKFGKLSKELQPIS